MELVYIISLCYYQVFAGRQGHRGELFHSVITTQTISHTCDDSIETGNDCFGGFIKNSYPDTTVLCTGDPISLVIKSTQLIDGDAGSITDLENHSQLSAE